MTTTDFEEWLANNEPEGIEEAYCLWDAAYNGESSGIYECANNQGKRFIKGPSDDALMLASPKAIAAFVERIKEYNPDPDLGWDGALAFRRGMQKDD